MLARGRTALLAAASILLLSLLFQIVGLIRYQARLPNDWIGIVLYWVTIAGLIATALLILNRLRSNHDQHGS
jgi:hypothetical protein